MPSVAAACASRGSWATTNPAAEPPPRGVRERRADLVPVDVGGGREDRRRREREQRDLPHRPERDAPQLHQLRGLDAGRRGGELAELVDVDLGRLQRAPQRRPRTPPSAGTAAGSATPSVPSASTAAATARSGPASIVVVTSSCARSVPSWCSSGPTAATPKSTKPARPSTTTAVGGSIRWWAIRSSASRASALHASRQTVRAERRRRAAQDEQRVVHGGLARGLDLVGRHAAARGQQRHERLVLGRLELAQRRRRARTPVPDPPPHPREQLAVVRVAPVDLDQQRPARRIDARARETPRRLALGVRQLRRVDAELGQPRGDVVQARPPRGRSPRQPQPRGDDDRDRQRRDDPAGRAAAADHRPEHAEHQHAAPEHLERAHEVRGHGDDRRRGLPHPQRREARIRPLAHRQPRRDPAQHRRQHERRQRLRDHHEAPPHQRRDDQRRRPQPQRAREQLPHRFQPAREARPAAARTPAPPAAADTTRSRSPARQQRGHEQHDVGPPPHPRLVDRRREHPPGQNAQKTGTSRTATTPKSTSIGRPSFQ